MGNFPRGSFWEKKSKRSLKHRAMGRKPFQQFRKGESGKKSKIKGFSIG